MRKLGIISVLTLVLTSCGSPEMDAKLIKSMTLGYERGIVAGIEIGDSFEDVKKNIHKEWELKNPEETEFSTYKTSSFSKSYDMMNFISGSISFDSKGKVTEIAYSISGKKGNHLLMAQLQRAFKKEFNSKYKVTEPGLWSFLGPNGNKFGLSMYEMDKEDVDNKTLSVSTVKY